MEHTSAVLAGGERTCRAALGGHPLSPQTRECTIVLSQAFPHLTILKHGDAPAGVLGEKFH